MIRRVENWSMLLSWVLLCFHVAPWPFAGGAVAQVGNQPADVKVPPKASVGDFESRLDRALDTKGDWQLVDMPLGDAAQAIGEKAGVDILIDHRALDEYGLGEDEPVTIDLEGVRFESCLNHLLRPLDLTWMVRDEAVWVTTPEEAEMAYIVRVYPVREIVQPYAGADERTWDYDSLIEAITCTITPDTWDDVGGPASIEPYRGTLIVTHSPAGHRTISALINHLHGLIRKYREDPTGMVPPIMVEPSANAKVRKALEQPITADWSGAPLTDVASALNSQSKVPVLMDVRALEEYGIDADAPVTLKVNRLPLRHALGRLLRPLELTWLVRDETLVITTPEEAEDQLLTVIYPVAHFVGDGKDSLAAGGELESLIEVISASIDPASWAQVGGPAPIGCLYRPPCLIVGQTEKTHEQISMLLQRLYHTMEGQQLGPPEVVDEDAMRIERYHLLLDQGETKISAEDVINMIMRSVPWDDKEGAYIGPLGDSIVVRHNELIHREIRRMLQRLGLLSSPPFSGFQGCGASGCLGTLPGSPGNAPGSVPSGGFGRGFF